MAPQEARRRYWSPVLLLIFGLLDALTVRDRAVPWPTLLAIGWVVATTTLTKFDTGLLCLLVAVGFLAAEGLLLHRAFGDVVRSTAFVMVGAAASVVVWWILLGQHLSDLGDWLVMSWQVFRGYESAMVSDSAVSVSPRASLLAVLVVVALSALCAWRAMSGRVGTRRFDARVVIVWTLSMCAFAAYAKQSFTRYDDGHLQRLYISAALTLITALGLRHRTGAPVLASRRALHNDNDNDNDPLGPVASEASPQDPKESSLRRGFGIVASTVTLAAVVVLGRTGADLVNAPKPDFSSWRKVATFALSGVKREAIVTRQRSLLPPELAIPTEVRTALFGGTVHIEPTETSVAWVFPELTWKPLPVFQSYSAYTPKLDDLNAAALAATDGPGLVLYRGGLRVDHRMARFESPAAQLSLICNFRPKVLTPDGWQVFERRPDGSGCASPTSVASLDANLGHSVTLPAMPEDAVVVATFSGLDRSLTESVRDSVLRAPKYWFVLSSPDPGEPAHRFVSGNAGQPHVVSLPACLRNAWGTYDTRTFQAFDLRGTEWPNGVAGRQATDNVNSPAGAPYTVTLSALRYKCPS